MKARLSAGLVWFAILASSPVNATGFPADDHLVPAPDVTDAQTPEAAYDKLWRQKLLVTPGEIARAVHLPGTVGAETAMSLDRKTGARRVEYWVTATQSSSSLWGCIAPDAEHQVAPESIGVTRIEARLPSRTALLVQKAWLAMLRQIRKPPQSEEIVLDSSTEIFSATDTDGKLLTGQFEGVGQGNAAALWDLANLLLLYCDSPEGGRDDIAHRIDKAAGNLLGRVASNSGDIRNSEKARNRKQISDASKVIAVRTLALVSSATEARLGSSVDDFRSAWGSPLREEVLGRTATFRWRPADQSNEALPSSIFEVEVSFLDQIACQIILRSKQPLKKADLVQLGKALVPLFQTSDLAMLKSESDGGRTYALSSGGYITAWAKENPAVVVLRSDVFLRDRELFDQEAAKVRPPTSNH